MLKEFSAFLTKTNALALAIGVIIGGASTKVVSALVEDILMPIIGLVLPAGDWRDLSLVLKHSVVKGKVVNTSLSYGQFGGAVLDFVLISLAVFIITKALIKEAPAAATKQCGQCLESIPAAALKCRACGSPV